MAAHSNELGPISVSLHLWELTENSADDTHNQESMWALVDE